jgi:hypothetical protein
VKRRPGALPLGTLLIAAVSLYVPFRNYGFSGEFIGGDAADAWALPRPLLHALTGVFLNFPGLGQNGALGIQGAFPALALATGLHALGVSTAVASRLIIALYFFAAMSGALRLCSALLPNRDRIDRAAALLAALFYGLNHYTIFLYATVQTYYPLGYVALPWLLYGVVTGCERNPKRGVALITVALLCAGGAATNPSIFGVALCAVFAGAVLELAQGVPWRRVLAVCGSGAALGTAACAWWLLPLPTRISAGLGQVSAEGGTSTWVHWMSERSSFAHLFKLDGYTGEATLPNASWHGSPEGDFVGYLPLVIALLGFAVVRPRFSRVALAVFALAAALSAGVHPPFGAIYQAMMDHIPGFAIYRSPYDKWVQLEALLLTVLFALGIVGFVRRLTAVASGRRLARFARTAALVCAAVPVVVYPWPAYVGKMLYTKADGRVGFISTIPSDYVRVASIIRSTANGFRTVTFNGDGFPYPMFTWGYFGEDPLFIATESPITGFETVIPRGAWMSAKALEHALRSLSVRYIVVHHDDLDPAASPDIGWLVAEGDVSLVYDSRYLSLYRLRNSPAPLVTVAHEPTLASRAGLYAGEPQRDDYQTGQIDPNIGFLAGDDARSFFMPATRGTAPAAERRFSTLTDLTPSRTQIPDEATLTFVPANPLGMVLTAATCGARQALRIEPPSSWQMGSKSLPEYRRLFCLKRPSAGVAKVDGKDVLVGDQQFALSNVAGDHMLSVSEVVVRVARAAKRQDFPGLPYAFEMPIDADAIEIAVPPGLKGTMSQVTIETADGTSLGSAKADGSAASVIVRIAAPCCRRQVVFLRWGAGPPALWRALSEHETLKVSALRLGIERFSFRFDERVLEGTRLTATDARGPLHETMRRRPQHPGEPQPLVDRPRWTTPEGVAVQSADGRFVLDAADAVSELQTTGQFLVSDRYRLRFSYVGSGWAETWISVSGYTSDHIVHLMTDGRRHDFDDLIYPPTSQDGRYVIRIRERRGTLRLGDLSLAAVGPNGNLLLLRNEPPLGGRIISARRVSAWWFDVSVADCTPCVLRVGVSAPLQWAVYGARVDATLEGQGQGTGSWWAGVTTGAAAWLLDAGPGVRRLTVLFVPALLAFAGLGVALIALALAAYLALSAREPLAAGPEPDPASLPSLDPVQCLSVALAGAVPLVGAASATAAEWVADALWFLLLALAANVPGAIARVAKR